jgi:predicted component of type VI protein secretion system
LTPVLVFTDGPLSGRRVEVVGELVLGREDVSLTIEDEEISRRHAVIRPTDGGIEIEDLGSTNGTYVNAVRIERPTRLAGGDTIRLGRSVLEVESVRAPATVAAAVPPARAASSPPAASLSAARSAPAAAFGAYAAPPAGKRSRGVASRQLGPQLVSFGVVAATAAALVVYFAKH